MTDDPGGAPTRTVRVRTVSLPILLVVAGGFATAAAGPWRPGLVVAGLALVVGGVLRVVLPAVRLGTLVVRSRVVDAGVLVITGGLILGLALTFPT